FTIAIVSRLFTAISISVLCLLAWRKRNQNELSVITIVAIFLILFYALFPVVNPWYLLPVITTIVFIPMQSILLWSALIVASSLALKSTDNVYLHVIASLFYLVIAMLWFIKDRKSVAEISTKNIN
ncbi:MAG: hypothetical protein RIQ33_2512, partial [Bacteroidota bacterium]